MGCIFSQEDKKDQDYRDYEVRVRRPPQGEPHKKSHNTSYNGQVYNQQTAQVKRVSTSAAVTVTNKNGELANNNQSQKASELDDADTPFRRQHFDRNSMLRHSKKRKKSSVSSNALNANSSTLNNSTGDFNATIQDQQPPPSHQPALPTATKIVVQVPPAELVVQKANVSAEIGDAILADDVVVVDNDHQSVVELRKSMEEGRDKSSADTSSDHLSASARVAALLSGSATTLPSYPVPVERALEAMTSAFESELLNGSSFQDEEEPQLTPPSPDFFNSQRTPSTFETLQESPVMSPDSKFSKMTNGHEAIELNHQLVTSTPLAKVGLAKNVSTPSRIPKLASGSSVSAMRTPSTGGGGTSNIPKGIRTPNGGGGNGAGRLVLRTRRQVAQELEEQERNKSSSLDEHEDCGRLI